MGALRQAVAFAAIVVMALTVGCRRDDSTDAGGAPTGSKESDAVAVETTPEDRLAETVDDHADTAGAGETAVASAPLETVERAAGPPGIPDPVMAEMQPRVKESLRVARARVVEDPSSLTAWEQFGVACDAHKLFDCAEACYRRALEIKPNDFRNMYFLAFVLDATGKGGDEAVDLYRAAAKVEPRYPPLYCRLGRALERRERLVEARDAYLQAIAYDQDFPMAHRGAGQVMLALDDLQGARRHLERAVALDRTDAAVFAALIRVYHRLGIDQVALSHRPPADAQITFDVPDPVREVVGRSAEDSVTYLERAKGKIHTGRHAEAISDLKIVESVKPDDPYVHVFLGTCYRRTGQRDLAVEHLQRAISLKEDSSSAHFELAVVMIEAGNLVEGMRHYNRAHELSPSSLDIHTWVGAALMRADFNEESINAFEAAGDFGPLDARPEALWGSALFKIGDYRGAATHFRRAVNRDPSYIDAYHDLGLALEMTGKNEEAITVYRKAVARDPDHRCAERLAQLVPTEP